MKQLDTTTQMYSAILSSVLIVLVGCAVAPTGSGGANGNGDGGHGGNALSGICGTRSAGAVPGAGTIEERITTLISPPGETNGLAQAFSFLSLGLIGVGQPIMNTYEVGANGMIVGTDERFAIVGGCLAILGEDEDESDAFDFDHAAVPDSGPCPEGQFPIGPGGVGDDGTGYICVATSTEACFDCSQSNQTWTQEADITTTYTALGTIDAVQIFDVISGGITTVAIEQGEQITFTLTVETEYVPG